MKLVQLIYCSQVSGRLSLDMVQSILGSAQKHNTPNNITGLLAFDDSNFLQVIEGGTTAVNRLYGSIFRDPRHHSVHLISFREIETRQFPLWSMGDCDLAKVNTTVIERYLDSPVFKPRTLSVAAALELLLALEALRRQEQVSHAL